MTLHIAFQGGTHGHFLRYFLDRFSIHTPIIDKSPFTANGTSHKSSIKYSDRFSLYHPTQMGFKDANESHCVITVSNEDILQLQRTVYIRPGDIKLDTNKDYIKFTGFPKEFNETISIQKLYGLKIDENTEVPKFILRDFVKLGFSDSNNHGYIKNNRELLKHKFNKVYYFPVNSFWDKELFFNHLSNLDKQFNLGLSIDSSAIKIHNEFIEKIPQLKTRNRCRDIISAIKEEKSMLIENIDIVEEAYIYSWIESTHRNILAPFTNSFFKNTKDIVEYIRWYPHFYHGMNPTLPNKRN